MNFNDTFIDLDHLKRSFPDSELKLAEGTKDPPFQ